jgi:hypothetical protein
VRVVSEPLSHPDNDLSDPASYAFGHARVDRDVEHELATQGL